MGIASKDLWTLALGPDDIDSRELAAAVEAQVASGDLDFRTRLLIRDALLALKRASPDRVEDWMRTSPSRAQMERILAEPLGVTGFPSLTRRVMQTTRPEDVLRFLRELGELVRQRQRIVIGGSVSLILAAKLSRRTEDIDVVDEVPAELRNQHQPLQQLSERYALNLAHFQSHFLPQGWETRIRSLGVFGQLEAYLVDPIDVILSKMFSAREKDRDDLRAVVDQFDKAKLIDRLNDTCRPLLDEPDLRDNAHRNWYVLFGEALPA
jgi:hypothetical protein